MKKKIIIVLAILTVIFALFSWPTSILKRYPMLGLEKCTEVTGSYKIGDQDEVTFAFDRDSKAFEDLFAQCYWQTFHRSPRDILPRGTRYHATESDDFKWDLYFTYDAVELPDGSICSGPLLHIQNWYGDVDIYFEEDTFSCYVKNQEKWLNDILQIMQGESKN